MIKHSSLINEDNRLEGIINAKQFQNISENYFSATTVNPINNFKETME